MAIVMSEDLHWADPSTWDLFDFLPNLIDERVVLVGTAVAGGRAGQRTASNEKAAAFAREALRDGPPPRRGVGA